MRTCAVFHKRAIVTNRLCIRSRYRGLGRVWFALLALRDRADTISFPSLPIPSKNLSIPTRKIQRVTFKPPTPLLSLLRYRLLTLHPIPVRHLCLLPQLLLLHLRLTPRVQRRKRVSMPRDVERLPFALSSFSSSSDDVRRRWEHGVKGPR